MEEGSLADWAANSGGGEYNSGGGDSVASQDFAHGGSWSAKLNSNGTSGTRLFRWRESRVNRAAAYSAWFYFPNAITRTSGSNYFNLLQFKSRGAPNPDGDPLWFVDLQDNGAGGLKPTLIWWHTTLAGPHSGESGFRRYQPLVPVSVPVGRWFQVSCRLYQSNSFDGALSCTFDGRLIFDLTAIKTSYVNCDYNSWCASNEVSFNNYSDGLSPNPATFYLDDPVISTG